MHVLFHDPHEPTNLALFITQKPESIWNYQVSSRL